MIFKYLPAVDGGLTTAIDLEDSVAVIETLERLALTK